MSIGWNDARENPTYAAAVYRQRRQQAAALDIVRAHEARAAERGIAKLSAQIAAVVALRKRIEKGKVQV